MTKALKEEMRRGWRCRVMSIFPTTTKRFFFFFFWLHLLICGSQSPHLTCWLAAGPVSPFSPCPEENSFLWMCTIRAQRVMAKTFSRVAWWLWRPRVCAWWHSRRWNPSHFQMFSSLERRGAAPPHLSDLDEKVDVSLVSNDNYFWRHSKEELKRAGISRRKIERKQKKKTTTGDNKRKLRTRETTDGRTDGTIVFCWFLSHSHTHTEENITQMGKTIYDRR